MEFTRIRLNNTVFEGQNNAYVIHGEVPTLIDTGVAMPEVRADLVEGLADAGLELPDLERILLTHWHADHSGLAGELAAESGATVFAHEADVPLVAGDDDAFAALWDRRDRRFGEWGIPPDKQAELESFRTEFAGATGESVAVEPLTDGDQVAAGDGELSVLRLPGHAAGLVAYETVAADGSPADPAEAFVGDAILPQYTPNVGGADLRVDRPLERYVDSLDRLAARDLDRAWPGHRDPIDDPAGRAAEIRTHHVERTRRVIEALREGGPADTWTVSARLFGDLEGIHILHGPGEASAHLDHLERHGIVDRDGTEYRLVDADPDVPSLFPNTKY
ncbi:MBL fold metallo-hydrolase [Halobellus ruber]|uniref:MBL fold metallo-hydrolase n=1 Tax=Halobellus ruber TaxID=2761102 RepID=A0A7J9SN28_9EURY|nr:MBL fold metallo-hydrolase [Halobellus ruber]MBB6647579.1 MBL fold metallo-hydrolase [Halobellus ruber]